MKKQLGLSLLHEIAQPELTLNEIIEAFAIGIERADALMPQVVSARTGRAYQPGIGPHSEPAAVRLIVNDLINTDSERFGNAAIAVPYPAAPRQRCDLVFPGKDGWAIEVKLARFKGDNGKPADETLMHIISPYEADRSALTDCTKLTISGFDENLAILIYGFDFPDKPLDPVIDAFELLAGSRVNLSERITASFNGLVHPVHRSGRVFGWQITSH